MTKILQVIPTLNPAGGGPVEARKRIASVFERKGCEVEVATLDAPGSPWLLGYSTPIHALGPGLGKYGYSQAFLAWLKGNVERFDAVLVHGIWQFPSLAVNLATRGTRVPYFVFVHGMLDPWFKQASTVKHLKKWLYWPWAEYRVLKDARAVLFTTEEERLLARQSFWLYSCNEVVPGYGTAAPTADPEQVKQKFYERFPELRGKRLVLFLGRIHPKKGCDLLIQAFAKAASADPALQLIIAGPDEVGLQAELADKAARLGIESRITWPGILLDEYKWGAMYASEVFALPSHQENFGIAVVEALACGLPVLISNKVNIWREVERDDAGIVGADDFSGTNASLEAWLTKSTEDRTRMAENAKACFAAHFNVESSAARLLEIIQSHVGLAAVGTR